MVLSITSLADLLRWFVSIKLSSETDYDWWPEPSMCQIESHGMEGLIHGIYKTPKENGGSKKNSDEASVECKRSDALVTGRISVLLQKYVMVTAVGLHTLSYLTSVINEQVVGSKGWMKKTAESYTIIVACINTIVFAAAITVSWNVSCETKPALMI